MYQCRGINLADIAELTDKSIQGGRLTYIRKKTGKEYSMRLNEKAASIVKRYAKNASKTSTGRNGRIFPIYSNETNEQEREKARKNLARRINEALRQIAGMMGFEIEDLSFYTARHSYADILKKAGVSVEVISQALGHSDIRVTDAYLKGFGDSVLDEADQIIMN